MRTSRFVRLTLWLATTATANHLRAQAAFDLDVSFRTNISSQYMTSMLPVEDGKLLISGRISFPAENPLQPHYGARLLANGTRDVTFEDYPGMGGKLTSWNGMFYSGAGQGVRRLNMDGTYDPTFILMNNGPYFSSLQGGDYHVFPDGRVLMSGAHILSDAERGFEGMYSLIWFSNEGYLDTTRIHRYCDQVIYQFEQQPDGKFLCSGTMNSFEDQPVTRVFRVMPDGALDPSFQAEIQQWGEARSYFTLEDGRILVGGVLKLNGSDVIRSLIRLNADGSLDETYHLLDFDATFGSNPPDPSVSSIYRLDDGRFIITGRFDHVDGEVRGGIAMLDADGTLLDDAFTGEGCGAYDYVVPSGTTTYKTIFGMHPASDGNYYIYGGYHGYDDGTTNDPEQRFVSRLYGLDVGVQERQEKPLVRLWPNPGNSILNIELSGLTERPAQLELSDAQGRTIARHSCWSPTCTWDLQGIAPGPYTVKILNGIGTVAVQWIKQ